MTRRERLTLLATILGSTIVFLDSTVVNVALPAIQSDLDTGLAGQQWVVEAYMLTLVAFMLVGGSLGDLYGRRRLFMIGLAGFGITSILCALAPDGRVPDRGPGAAGRRGRAARAGIAGDPRGDLRGRGARQGGRPLDRLERDLDPRRARGRRPAGRARLALDLLGQHPARPRHAVAGPPARCARAPTPRRAPGSTASGSCSRRSASAGRSSR